MAKGDILQGGTATVPQYGQVGNPWNLIAQLMQNPNMMQSLLPSQHQNMMGTMRDAANNIAGMRKTMGPQDNPFQRGWGVGRFNPNNPSGNSVMLNPQGMMRGGPTASTLPMPWAAGPLPQNRPSQQPIYGSFGNQQPNSINGNPIPPGSVPPPAYAKPVQRPSMPGINSGTSGSNNFRSGFGF
jgi:hypothetical protein